MTTARTLVYESELGTLSRTETDGVFTGLKVRVRHPATTPGWVELVQIARSLGYEGRLNCLDFHPDGSESWVIYPEVPASLGRRSSDLVLDAT